jgi:CheY-like chemotaxis protein
VERRFVRGPARWPAADAQVVRRTRHNTRKAALPMSPQDSLSTAKLAVDLVQVLIWPAIVVFVLLYFGKALKQFASSLGEFSFKAAGVEATAKRQQIEAAALLGAAVASRPAAAPGSEQPPGEDARDIAGVIAERVTPRTVRRLIGARVLWVDDRPDNNVYERQALEALGIRFTLSTSTEDALEKTTVGTYDAIISDMGRPPDPRAGYTLLDSLRKRGDATPFVIYAGSNAPEHKAEARSHGALGSTNRAQELFELVLTALSGR